MHDRGPGVPTALRALLAAALAVSSIPLPAAAQEAPVPVKDTAPLADGVGSHLDPYDRKRRERTQGTPMGRPADKEAGRTSATRSAYLAALLADEAREARAGYLDDCDRACLDAALAAVPAAAAPDVRKALDDAKGLLAAGRWADAQTQAAQASALDWKLLAPRLVAARALVAQGRAEDAVKGPLDTAVASAPDDPVALHARALVAWRLGRLDDARKDLVHAREARPSEGPLALSLGALELDRGDAKAARDVLLAATDALPRSVFALRSLARALYLCEDWTGAAAVFERIVRLVEGPPLPPGQIAIVGRGTVTTEHLALAILCADRLDRRAAAKSHAQAFLQEGGIDLSLDAWLKSLVAA